MLFRKLSTGDVALFHEKKRELIVVAKRAARGVKTWEHALELVPRGSARHFSKTSLKALTEALQHVVLLGG